MLPQLHSWHCKKKFGQYCKTHRHLITICGGICDDWVAWTRISEGKLYDVDWKPRHYELRTQASQEMKNCIELSCQMPPVTSWGVRCPTEQQKWSLDTLQSVPEHKQILFPLWWGKRGGVPSLPGYSHRATYVCLRNWEWGDKWVTDPRRPPKVTAKEYSSAITRERQIGHRT